MPTDSGTNHDLDRDREYERDRDMDRGERGDRGGSKQKSSTASKTKDLSHVPCKFYKVGGCTAGSSCPFSHSTTEPGAQKETCTWFIKGNCKFGHKCALAHILPGQSMAMDRKNKKAAQHAAATSSVPSGEKSGKSSSRVKRETSSSNGANRLPLLAGGATAPTRDSGSSSSGRPPMNMALKATISPSAPAPALKDTDFFAPLEEMEGLNSTPSQSQTETISDDGSKVPSSTDEAVEPSEQKSIADEADPIALPSSGLRTSKTSASNDFGPIGSPPNYRSGQPISPNRANGVAFSPGTSPRGHSHINGVNISSSPSTHNNAGMLSSSPFSAPGTQSIFLSNSYSTAGGNFSTNAGIASSLGSGLAMMGGRKGWGDVESGSPNVGANSFSGLLSSQLSSSVSQQRTHNGFGSRGNYDISIEYDEFGGGRHGRATAQEDIAVEDEDLEDFLPSSLNDLLTPEERNRRMSRSNSGQAPGIGHLAHALANPTATADSGGVPTGGNGQSNMGHRYSRSVPAPSLLGDIKSIWSDTSNAIPSTPPTHRGTPSASYSSRYDPYTQSHLHDEAGLSMSMGSAGTASSIGMMSPSNASAAFLPGLHSHYLNAKAKQAQAQQQQAQLGLGGIGRQLRGTSNPLYSGQPNVTNNNSLASNYLQPLGGLGLPSSASSSSNFHTHTHGNTQTTYRTTPSPFDLTQTLHQPAQTARPIPSNLSNQKSLVDDPLLGPHLLSPNARALQQHAPGQSLPQGLAAGYSRIHALPPLSNIASPPNASPFAPGTSPGGAINDGYPDWASGSMQPTSNPPATAAATASSATGGSTAGTGLETMFSRLSYSAAARGVAPNAAATQAPPGLSRNVSSGRYNQPGGPLSPLSGPVVSRDDDDLFDMDK